MKPSFAQFQTRHHDSNIIDVTLRTF